MSASVSVDVVSDVVCPWCFLGQRRLARAVDTLTEVEATVRWKPFQLDASIPAGGLDRREYMLAKFGDGGRIEQAHERLRALGEAEGIRFRFEDIRRSPNTLDAHRLIRWAGAESTEAQGRLVRELFERYFEQGEDIGDHAVLADAARSADLVEQDWTARLRSDEDRAAVAQEAVQLSQRGVTGVPFFILAGRYGLSGAQEAEVLAEAIGQAARLA